ncbi:MAG: LytR/AlgR family response regulator transcription factor [Lachnospiraceae bacterium]
MVNIAIVEDDEHYISIIQEYLETYRKEKCISIHIDIFRNGNQILFHYEPAVYDILLMDIEMPGIDGMSAAEHIRKVDKDVIILFITSMAQYAIKGYQVRARSYILKPVNYYSFAFELEEAIGALSKKVNDSLLFPDNDGMRKIPVCDIYYVESQKHNMLIHTKNDIISIRESMKNMEEKLQKFYFERCNVSFLVNLAYVSAVEGDLVKVGTESLPISRQKKKSFLAALTKYVGGN